MSGPASAALAAGALAEVAGTAEPAREPGPNGEPLAGRRVVHLLERFTDDVLQLLGPTTDALSLSALEQVVVLVDDPRRRPLLARFDASIELVLVPAHGDLLMQWRALAAAFVRTLAERPAQAIHLHGFVASLIGEHALRKAPQVAPVFYSPHDSRSLRSLRGIAMLARLVAKPFVPRRESLAIGHGAHETKALQAHTAHRAVQLVEGPVGDAFFEVEPNEARHPLVIGASPTHNVHAVEAFDQLAVLLGSGALRLAFNWIGPVNAVSAARLRAANVGVFEPGSDAQRASRLSAGWLFVALGGQRGFPLALAEAMAAGLPCVALDSPAHRELVNHGETGYLCRDQSEVIDRIAQLIDTPRTRHRMSRTARVVARERFSAHSFRQALLAAYQSAGDVPLALAAPAASTPPLLPAPDAVHTPEAAAPVSMAMSAAAVQECP